MSPIRRILFSFGSSAILCGSVFADTIILKSGEKIEGKVIAETPTELTVEVRISAGVTDQTKIARDTIEKIEKEKLDEVAWVPLKAIQLGANSLPATQYDAVIQRLKVFVMDYPESAHKAEAEKAIAAFEAEKKRVDGGEVRLGQEWLGKEEVAKERTQIGAMLAYQYMRGQMAAGDLVGALNSFDQIDKSFNGARVYPDAVDTARSALAGLKQLVDRAQKNYQAQQAEYETGVTNAVEPQKSQLKAARQRETAQGEAAVAAAERAGVKWPPLMLRSEKSISTLAQKIPTEMQRLEGLDVAKMRASIKSAQDAAAQIADKKVDAADESLRKASELWSANEMLTRLQPELTTLRSTVAAAAAQPEPMPAEATPAPAKEPVAETVTTSDDDMEPSVESDTPFLMTPGGIIIAIIGLAVIIAGFTAYKKVRGKASDILE